MGHGRSIKCLVLRELEAGDCAVVQTANSTYRFWIEFPDEAIGVLQGGNLAGPTRVRLGAEGVHVSQAALQPLCVGERAHATLLGPNGSPVRSIVTSTIASIRIVPHRRAAA